MIFTSDIEAGVITMRGTIGDYEDCISADDFLTEIQSHSGDITIRLNSPGGVVDEGLSIHNAIKQYPGKVRVEIDTLCASVATVIACAADEIVMDKRAKWMIHRCWTVAMGNCKDFRSTALLMEMLDDDIVDVYHERTGAAKDVILDKMDKETWMTAAQAIEFGFANALTNEPKEDEDSVVEALGKPVAMTGLSPAMKAFAENAVRRARRA